MSIPKLEIKHLRQSTDSKNNDGPFSSMVDPKSALVQLLADATIVAPLLQTALLHSRLESLLKQHSLPAGGTFLYIIENANSNTFFSSPSSTVQSTHGVELSWLFGAQMLIGMDGTRTGTTFPHPRSNTSSELARSQTIMTVIGNFVKHRQVKI